MSGGAYEYVMGNMVDSSGNFYLRYDEFSFAPAAKYYDSYAYAVNPGTYSRGLLGDATKEILKAYGSNTGGWYLDCTEFPNSSSSWFMRGGSISFRIVLSAT